MTNPTKSITEGLKQVKENQSRPEQVFDLPEDAVQVNSVSFDFISYENREKGETVSVEAEFYKSMEGIFVAFNMYYSKSNFGSDGYLKLSTDDPDNALFDFKDYIQAY